LLDEDVRTRLVARSLNLPLDTFLLQATEEEFDRCIIPEQCL
jgi:hypothetical protein